MAKDLKDIQQLINERAEQRFNADYFAIVSPISSSKLFEHIQFDCYRNGSETKSQEGMYWVFREGYGNYEKVKEKWLPKYISEESENFLAKVESIKNDVDNLMSNQYQEEY
jgi:hypothetical protein